MILTRSQQALFWRTFSAAVRNLGIADRDAQTAYRRRVLADETGKSSLKVINRTTDYDRVITRLALDADDYELAARFDIASERRWSYMCETCATQIGQILDSDICPANYIAGICKQAGYPGRFEGSTWWMDLSLNDIVKLFAMLDTHRRRLLNREGFPQLRFWVDLTYSRNPAGEIISKKDSTARQLKQPPLRIS